jgi:hypothetical protein
MKIRFVKTASKTNAVQVDRYQNNKMVTLQHLGSAHTSEALNELILIAVEWIKDFTIQLSVFPALKGRSRDTFTTQAQRNIGAQQEQLCEPMYL